jgi:uncharacterized damage-inducible protein DinB
VRRPGGALLYGFAPTITKRRRAGALQRMNLSRLDTVHNQLTTYVRELSDDVFTSRVTEGQWSVGEVVEHLCLVEDRVLASLKKNVALDPVKIPLRKRLFPMRLISYRFLRVEAPKAVRPVESLSKNELLDKYDSVRARTKEFCSQHSAERLKQTAFTHPFLGQIDGTAAISMVGFHEQRHLKQIREIVSRLQRV